MRHAEPSHWWKLILFLLMATLAAAGCSGDGDDDPCADVTCGGHGTCSVVEGEAVCTCEAGYELVENKKNCIGTLCSGEDCCGHGSCVQEGIDTYCNCEEGYYQDPADPLCCACDCRTDADCTSVEYCADRCTCTYV